MALIVDRLSYARGNRKLVDAVSLVISKGQIVAFLGPNGAGKTTVLKSVVGLLLSSVELCPEKHYVQLDGICLCSASVQRRIAAGLVYMSQQNSLLEGFTSYENLEILFQYHCAWRGKTKHDFELYLEPWIEKMAIRVALHTKVEYLSGGQKRKIELLRALAMYPKYLLLDEPFAGVDPKSIEEIQELLRVCAQTGVGILISDHHVFQLLHCVDYCYVLVAGQVLTQGTPEEIMYDTKTQEVYLGKKMGYHKKT